MTGKQRAQLRAMANGIDTVVYIGKDGVTEAVLDQAEKAIYKRELIKCKVQDGCMLSAREACGELCEALGAFPVQTIGNRFVIYRPNPDEPVIVVK
jgi:RNA-binding protein